MQRRKISTHKCFPKQSGWFVSLPRCKKPFLKLMQYLQLNVWKYLRHISFSDSHLFRCFFRCCVTVTMQIVTPIGMVGRACFMFKGPVFSISGYRTSSMIFSNAFSLWTPKKYLLVVADLKHFRTFFPQQNKQHKTLNMMKFLGFIWYRFSADLFGRKDANHQLRPLQPWHNYCRVIH